MFALIKKALLKRKNKQALKKWKALANATAYDEITVSRHAEDWELYCDMYWRIKSADGKKLLHTIYKRCNKLGVVACIRNVEDVEMPRILAELAKEMKK